MPLLDISRPLGPTAPWPGDAPFEHRLTGRLADGFSCNVGALKMGTHNATHVDAPFHYVAAGATIEALDPALFVGPAVVADVTAAGWAITRESLADAARLLAVGKVPRLLLKTGAWPDHARFPERLPLLAPEVPPWLAEQGVRLLGLDVPSVDNIDSKDLAIHHALARVNVYILESLDLSAVAAGVYELIALPLRIVGGDASPVRAVLRTL